MAHWDTQTVEEAVTMITENSYVLPVIQRRLVWEEEKMSLLFDTLLKKNSFGGVMALEEDAGAAPLFAFRSFTKDGEDIRSVNPSETLVTRHTLIIDGQQRLQTFYIGLRGSFNGKQLYFNLDGDYEKLDFDFLFAADPKTLPARSTVSGDVGRAAIWYPAGKLFERGRQLQDRKALTREVIAALSVPDDRRENVADNIETFWDAIFGHRRIGISKVHVDRSRHRSENRQRIVELFQRLNDGGTRLSSFDLVASVLKGFDWEMERFLEDTVARYQPLGIGQDELIKLIFILQDDHQKEMVNVTERDATFAIASRERISASLEACENFLRAAKFYDYYAGGNRSTIPLFFIAYHVFHSSVATPDLSRVFDRHDVKKSDFHDIYRWLVLSLLNGTFKSKGAGWIPYKTGIRKILGVMSQHKAGSFPIVELLNIYRQHPLNFFEESVHPDRIDQYDALPLFYILYGCETAVRLQDIDHVHPRSILDSLGILAERINSLANLQLLDRKTNRGEKNGKELGEWIARHVDDSARYLAWHSIPSDSALWNSGNFDDFLAKRSGMVADKINGYLAMGR